MCGLSLAIDATLQDLKLRNYVVAKCVFATASTFYSAAIVQCDNFASAAAVCIAITKEFATRELHLVFSATNLG